VEHIHEFIIQGQYESELSRRVALCAHCLTCFTFKQHRNIKHQRNELHCLLKCVPILHTLCWPWCLSNTGTNVS